MSYFNQCIDLDKANNIVEYIKLLEAKLGYEFTREAKETICSKISNAAFKEQKTGKTIGQMDVKQPSKLNVPIASKALKIWRECKGDVKVYREEIDKLAITEANKVYLKSADYIATLRRISDKDKSM